MGKRDIFYGKGLWLFLPLKIEEIRVRKWPWKLFCIEEYREIMYGSNTGQVLLVVVKNTLDIRL